MCLRHNHVKFHIKHLMFSVIKFNQGYEVEITIYLSCVFFHRKWIHPGLVSHSWMKSSLDPFEWRFSMEKH